MKKEIIKIVLKVLIYALGLIAAYLGVSTVTSCAVKRDVQGNGVGVFHYVDTFRVNHNSTLKYGR